VAGRRSGRRRRTSALFKFDQSYLLQHACIAGVDEVGVGPLAGPVVAAAVILPVSWRHPSLNDSKQLTPEVRKILFKIIQEIALAIGVGIVDHEEIDRINIRQASFAAMRLALAQLKTAPAFVLVDGFRLPHCVFANVGIIDGDAKSAHIAAASVIAKVTRDALMTEFHEKYPIYGFHKHKGYGTPEHLAALRLYGPTPIHRKSFAPVTHLLS
jgi:ribonuclease HII